MKVTEMKKIRFCLSMLALGGLSLGARAQVTTVDSGYCGANGNNLEWKLTSDSTLTISGSGDMADYLLYDSDFFGNYYTDAPWYSHINSITIVRIGDSVTTIGRNAFLNCINLTAVTIPISVTSIRASAFNRCLNLLSVTIPDSVTSIEGSAFANCVRLTSVIIGNNVKTIGSSAFMDCRTLTSVTIPNSVANIGGSAFVRCHSLVSATLSNNLTSIDGLFCLCASLTSITIPNSVTTIGGSSFDFCSSLEYATIGNGVTTIGQWAFGDCSMLKSITIYAITPPEMLFNYVNEIFRNVPNTIPIYVPCGSIPDYQSAWTYFSNYKEFVDTTVYSATICEGETYSDSNFTNLTKEGRYCITLQSDGGCDSVIELTLSYYPAVPFTTYADTICSGTVYNDVHFKNLTTSGVYYDTLKNTNGCDSIIEFTLYYYPSVVVQNYEDIICENGTYSDVYFSDLTLAGIYKDTLKSIYGCDSLIINFTLHLYPSIPITNYLKSIVEGETYNDANFKNLTQAGVYYDTLENINGCDSIICLTLTVTGIGIVETDNYPSLRVYPNPAKNELRIRSYELQASEVYIQIYSVVGQMVVAYPCGRPETTIDIAHLVNGIYYLKINNKVVKFVKMSEP